MLQQHYNIAIVSDDINRSKHLTGLLQDTRNKEHLLSFAQAYSNKLLEIPFDVVLIDCVSNPELNYSALSEIREYSKLENISFIFIISISQETLKRQIYKNPNNFIVIDPADRFAFISMVNNALYQSAIERKNLLYKDIIEGEKKLLSHMDELLEMDRIVQFTDETSLLQHLEQSFIRRLELALAVETALFTSFDKKRDILALNIFEHGSRNLLHKHTFRLKQSLVKRLLNENYPHIFEGNALQDPFVMELEEALGIKIFSLLFIPVTVFHEPRAGIILINKLYRDEFTENDLSFSMIAANKITYHLEKIQLEDFGEGRAAAGSVLTAKNEVIVQEWTMLKHIMDSVHFGTIVFDSSYDVFYMNPASFKILNKNKTEQPYPLLTELFDSAAFTFLDSLIKKDKFPVIREELQLQDPQIPHFYIGLSIYTFPEKKYKEKDRYILVFSEISRTKRIQAEIVRMDRMASLGALSSGIAHEIRNPLAGIKAMVQSLEEQLEDDTQKTEYIQRILRQVNRLTTLLKAFFTYARPSLPDASPVSIHKIIDEVIPLIDRKLSDKKIKFKQNYSMDLEDVFVDANQIQQVFLNLFLNAADAMPEGGILEIKAVNTIYSNPIVDRRKPASGLLSDSFVQIIVKDNGIGISEKVCKKIFDPFYSTKSTGTGLGLSIVYQIIKEHGGRIDVLSEEGQGTEFLIILPAFQKNRRDAEPG